MSATIRIDMLGPLRVSSDGNPLDVGGAKQAAVLAALLVESGKAISTDRLIDRVWDDDPPPSAVATLQAYVSNIRRALEPDHVKGTPFCRLVTRARGYALELDDEAVDARRFEGLVADGRALLAAGEPGRAREAFASALGLWRGDPFADLPEAFARAEASRLEQLRSLAQEQDIEASLELGEHEAVIPRVRSLITEDPLREGLYAHLMLALYRSGRQAEALRSYQDAREVLAEDLGIDPGPSLRRLEGLILQQAPDLEWSAPRAEAATPAARREHGLVGRVGETKLFDQALEWVARSSGRVIVLHGEPGIGKTRLAEEIAGLASDRGNLVAWGRCLEGGAAPPFWPWTQILRELGGDKLAALVPDGGGSVTSRIAIYESIARAMRSLAADTPIVVVLDDLQWSDVPSLELLRFVAQATRDAKILVAATYRDTELTPDHPLVDVLGTLPREAVTDQIHVKGLDFGNIAEIVERATGTEPDDRLVTELCGRTGGNPFFVSELVRLLENDGSMSSGPNAVLGTGIPVGVRDVVGRRISRLPLQTSEMLDVAATIGKYFSFSVLEVASAIDRDTLLDRLEVALAAGIVVRDEGTFDRYRFSHDIVRQTVYGALPPVRRARMHSKVADALVALWKDEPDWVSRLGHHYWEAATVCGPQRALPFVMLAAERAYDQLAYEAAEKHFDRGLRLARSLPPTQQTEQTALYAATRLARLSTMLHGYSSRQSGETWEVARGLAERVDAGHELLTALFGLWGFHCVRAEFEEARVIADRIMEESERRNDHGFRYGGYMAKGVLAMHWGRNDEAAQWLEKANAMAPEFIDPQDVLMFQQAPLVSGRCFLAIAESYRGNFSRSAELMSDAIAEAEGIGDPFTLCYAVLMSAWDASLAGDVERAADLSARGGAIANRFGFVLWQGAAAVYDGWSLAVTGEREEGEQRILDGLRALDVSNTGMLKTVFLGFLAEVQMMDGRIEEARATAAEGIALAESNGEFVHVPRLRAILETAGAGV